MERDRQTHRRTAGRTNTILLYLDALHNRSLRGKNRFGKTYYFIEMDCSVLRLDHDLSLFIQLVILHQRLQSIDERVRGACHTQINTFALTLTWTGAGKSVKMNPMSFYIGGDIEIFMEILRGRTRRLQKKISVTCQYFTAKQEI